MPRLTPEFGSTDGLAYFKKTRRPEDEGYQGPSGIQLFGDLVRSESDTLQGLSDQQHSRLLGFEEDFGNFLDLVGDRAGSEGLAKRTDAAAQVVQDRADKGYQAIADRIAREDANGLQPGDIMSRIGDRVDEMDRLAPRPGSIMDEIRDRVAKQEREFRDTRAQTVMAMQAGTAAAVDAEIRNLRSQARAAGSNPGPVNERIAQLKSQKGAALTQSLAQAGVNFNSMLSSLNVQGTNQLIQAAGAESVFAQQRDQRTGQLLQASGQEIALQQTRDARTNQLMQAQGQVRQADQAVLNAKVAADQMELSAKIAGDQTLASLAQVYPALGQFMASNPPPFVSELSGMLSIAELSIAGMTSGTGSTAINSAFGVPTRLPNLGVLGPDEPRFNEVIL
jgi:hypothetical protein